MPEHSTLAQQALGGFHPGCQGMTWLFATGNYATTFERMGVSLLKQSNREKLIGVILRLHCGSCWLKVCGGLGAGCGCWVRLCPNNAKGKTISKLTTQTEFRDASNFLMLAI